MHSDGGDSAPRKAFSPPEVFIPSQALSNAIPPLVMQTVSQHLSKGVEMVRFLSTFLVGWLLADVMRGSMNHITPVVVPVVLVCIAFTLANKRLQWTLRLSAWLKNNRVSGSRH